MFETVSITEVCWVALCSWGAWHHWHIWRAIQRDLDDLDAGRLPISRAALALFRNDAETEFDWTALKATLGGIGIVGMLQPNPPLDAQGWVVVALLFGIVVWTRLRSEVRGRRRARIKASTDRRRAP